MSIIELFLAVFAIGGFVCGVIWFFAHKRIQRSWPWRATFCFLIAASITPTAFIFWDSLTFIPAVFSIPFVFSFNHQDSLDALLRGVLPICAVASLIFGVWTIILRRRNRVA